MKVETFLIFICIIFCSLYSCNSQPKKSLNDIKTEGVLIAGSITHYRLEEDIKIVNNDNTIYTTISRKENQEIVLRPQVKKIEIRAFYPDYDIIIFDADKKENEYLVYVGSEVKRIVSYSGLTYMNWEDFISGIYLGLTDESPLKTLKDDNSETIKDYKLYSYEVTSVEGDWLKVRCLKDCEGCPSGTMVEGWVKWRNKNQLLVELFYLC